MKNKKIVVVAGVLLALFITAGGMYLALQPAAPQQTVPIPAPPPAVPAPAPKAPEPAPAEAPAPLVIQERFTDLLAQNKDVVGWLNLPHTKVDYPVAKSLNNDYYLHRDLNRKPYDPGTLFMDYRNAGDATNRHTIIYGHNMKNGTMFGTLKLYKKKDFYEANRIFTYSTLYEDTQWEIFSAYISPATLDLIPTDFTDDDDFMKFITTRQHKSMYPSDIVLKPTDKVLTLITCTYEIDDGRFVIHARKVEK